ncbi:unnamed protein product [Withania somnifera]
MSYETRRFRINAFRKKAINASNKFTRSLRKRGKRKVDYRFPAVLIEDVRYAEEENVVYELHQQLIDRNLLPPIHDDYHTLLRFLKARDFNIEKTIQMWEEMLNWQKEYEADTILEVVAYYMRRPVYIERLGQAHANKLMRITTIDRYMRYHVQEFERALHDKFPACSIAAKKRICSTTTILDVQGLGVKDFSKTVATLLAAMEKVDSNYYPETLQRMFIVNACPGFQKILWPAAQKILDAKTIGKIQVLEPKSLGKLLEVIDPSQLTDFLGGSCTCSAEGRCLRSNKGPWSDPEIMKLVHNLEAKTVKQISGICSGQRGIDSYKQIRSLKGRINDSSTVESVSDVHDPCSPIRQSRSSILLLSQLDEEARTSNSTPYSSCDDQFSPGEQVEVYELVSSSCQEPAECNLTNFSTNGGRNSEGGLVIQWFQMIQEKVLTQFIQCLERKLIPFILKLSAFFHSVFFEYWSKQAIVSCTSALEERQESSSSVNGEAVHKADEALLCMEHLHRLETLFEEIKRKPAEIPAEKDQMIQQSMEKIKSVEVDLDKTKGVLHTAVIKQLEIAELLENLQQSRFHRRRSLC